MRVEIGGNLGHVEIEPPLVLAHRAPGDREGHDHRQQVQSRMHAHQAQAALPVDAGGNLGAEGGQGLTFGRDMDDLGLVAVGVDGGGDDDA